MTPLYNARGQAAPVRLNTLPPTPGGLYETQIIDPEDTILATYAVPFRRLLAVGDLTVVKGVEFQADLSDPRFWIRSLNVGDLAVLWLPVESLRAEIDRHEGTR